ncbi:MAG TPA: FAD-dependent monooxygenase [Acidimicrobiales bacterium]|nr:FAD-dependent monooxygenase [Acidimicrobiales bacterium]
MKVSIVGAGPAGLYLGILLMKADPAHEIRIMERNPPDATFGWGVVFSGETLGQLRDADLQTYVEITDRFAQWDAVDIRYRGRLLRSRGHAFSAIARKQLLAILQRRCEELGVKLEFGVEIDDPATVAGDLVVAADGVNSAFRRRHADVLGSVVEPQGCKYVWFGTDLVFDAFRFIFRETDHGLFQVHAYPFDEHASTFIVECPERTWRRSGLDGMNERESIAFCEGLFAEDLDGHHLLSNHSVWLDFLRVRNRSWHHRNIVLLGDAAHTAHFSIGSGTKLAMEDAIALANAFVRHTNIEAALVDYELERQPVVERVQQAADESAGYFQRVEHHAYLEPMQFAFHLLTRSGRISHASLEVRDPDFLRVLDTWFDGAARAAARQLAVAPPPLFAPLSIGGLSLPNRAVRAADRDALGDVASGGAGLVLTRQVAVTPDGRMSPDCPAFHADEQADAWTPVVDDVHRAGALVMLQLGHAGRRGATQPRTHGVDLPLRSGGWPLLSASPLRYGPFGPEPKAMDDEDMARVRRAFAAAASRAAIAGFDALELDFAHGYLLASFLSPLTNRRHDGYGGALGNRLRFPLDVLDDVRTVWPDDRLLGVRLTVTDWARGGLGVDEGVEIARALTEHGAQLIHVEAGQTVAEGQPEYGRGFLTALSDRVRSEARVPTLVGGYLTTPDAANTIIGAGRADLCLLELTETDLDRQVAS